MADLLEVDGSVGGGQILRSALTLSALSGRAFAIRDIRKTRARAGLMRQHLAAVRAAAQICDAEVAGAELGATRLTFRPGAVRAGRYHFAVGSAGSACLVLQTVLLPLALASAASELSFEGGTHNPLAPPYPFLDKVFFPVLERMGVALTRALTRPGFHPAGGGKLSVSLPGSAQLQPLSLHSRGAQRRLYAEALVVNLPHHIAQRELHEVQTRLALPDSELHVRTPEADGVGNALLIVAEHEHSTELVVSFGAKGVSAERVAYDAYRAMATYLHADVPVGEHLADQLLLPMALAGEGSFCTLPLSDHARSNIQVIERFLPVRFRVAEQSGQTTISVRRV